MGLVYERRQPPRLMAVDKASNFCGILIVAAYLYWTATTNGLELARNNEE